MSAQIKTLQTLKERFRQMGLAMWAFSPNDGSEPKPEEFIVRGRSSTALFRHHNGTFVLGKFWFYDDPAIREACGGLPGVCFADYWFTVGSAAQRMGEPI